MQPQKVSPPSPPLQNFVPPPDVIADALAKSNRRSASTVKELVSWARDYFCAFLRSEGFDELFTLWESILEFLKRNDTGAKKEKQNDEDDDEEDVPAFKAIIQKSLLHLNVEKLNDPENAKDCLDWIKDAHNKIYETLQEV